MSSSPSSEADEYEKRPLESLDDLPTDDSESVGSSSNDDDDDSSVDETEPAHQSNSLAPVAYDEASSSSSENDSSDDSNDEEDDAVEEERNAPQNTDDSSSDSSSSDESDDDMQHLSLQERLQLKQDAGRNVKKERALQKERKRHALKVASERLHRQKNNQDTNENTNQTSKKKRSKHKPTEASSKRRDYFSRGAPTLDSSGIGVAVTAHRYKPRDPRIMGATSKSSAANNDNYAFLQEMRDSEIARLKKQVAVRKLPGKKGQKARRKLGLQAGSLQDDQEELTRLLQEKASYDRAQVDMAAKQAVKRKLKEQVASGKGVYYLKKREMKKLQLEAKYEELRKRGGDKAVDKALAKRRKKLKSKDTGYFIPKDA